MFQLSMPNGSIQRLRMFHFKRKIHAQMYIILNLFLKVYVNHISSEYLLIMN